MGKPSLAENRALKGQKMPNKPRKPIADGTWECIDPSVGQNVWQLKLPDLGAEQIHILQAHLGLCDACRFDQALEKTVESGLNKGDLTLPEISIVHRRDQQWWQNPAWAGFAGAGLVAACITLLMVLPPRAEGDLVQVRGECLDTGFNRPMEGEVVSTGGSRLSWKPIEGAGSYQIQVTENDGPFTWMGTTNRTEIDLPVLEPKEGDQKYRAILQTIPADLVTPGSISVSFRAGHRSEVLWDRLSKAPLWVLLFGLAGLPLLGFSARRILIRKAPSI